MKFVSLLVVDYRPRNEYTKDLPVLEFCFNKLRPTYFFFISSELFFLYFIQIRLK